MLDFGLEVELLLFCVMVVIGFDVLDFEFVVVLLFDQAFDEGAVDFVVGVEGCDKLLDLLLVYRFAYLYSGVIMILEFHNLLSVLVMNVRQLITHTLILTDQVIPIIFQLVSYIVEILYFPLCLRQLLLYAQLLLLMCLCRLEHLLILLLRRLLYLCL